MIWLFYILAAVLIYLSFKSFRGGIEYLNFFKRETAKADSGFTPFATIIAPCKGVEENLKGNLLALAKQDYPNYEVVFVVDDKSDEAVQVIEEVSLGTETETKLVIAQTATGSSQKAENLREAVLHVSDESTVFVFADSDVRPAKNWLRDLVAPLENENIGAATAYRWFISERPDFPSEMRSAWNASVASALGPNTKTNFCWGGSTAIRREIFDKLDIREKWRGVVSDDFALTRALNGANLPIVFVPTSLTATPGNCTFDELIEFTTRQIKITRVYSPRLWLMTLFGSFIFNVVFIWGIFILFLTDILSFNFWIALITLLLVSAFSIGKSRLRLKAVRLVLKDYEKQLAKQVFTQNILWIISPAIFFYNCVAALFSRRIVWRGIKYELKSPSETVIITQ